MPDGPLISTFNSIVNRLHEIEAELKNIDEHKSELLRERTVLLADVASAKLVLAHLTPYAEALAGESADAETVPRDRTRRRPIREVSSVGRARAVLRQAQRPMHIDDIIKMTWHMFGERVQKATLVSGLSRYVKVGDTFTRTAANTYALIPTEGEMRLVG